ncbi:hypothetical protein GJ744_005805 [Endocarpon pusillum]|uniref:Uncharacterized protein n=1 Tax=Endocarpon pusillum TaxID=364733 RepID=A0A8H7A8F8_9EURO|nr:hypothetical protein GJ744_005805 [Endocarpon pusillum]
MHINSREYDNFFPGILFQGQEHGQKFWYYSSRDEKNSETDLEYARGRAQSPNQQDRQDGGCARRGMSQTFDQLHHYGQKRKVVGAMTSP